MKKLIYTILIGGILTSTMACRKYVEVPPLQTKLLVNAVDYQQLLQNTTDIDPAYYLPLFSGDDVGTQEATWQTSLTGFNAPLGNAYTWAAKYYGALEEDGDWQIAYKQIFIYNTIVQGVMGSTGSEVDKQKALSSALVQRAFMYHMLVNMYANQYDATTAAADPGVPLLLEPKFTTDLTRASVQQVYEKIKMDVLAAIPGLPDLPEVNSNASKASAYALLARIYLNTREFTEAGRYASLSLGLKNTVLDLNTYKSTNVPVVAFPNRIANGEEILFKRTRVYPSVLPLSADAVSMYDQANDLRWSLFTMPGASIQFNNFTISRGYFRPRLANDGTYVGLSVPEVLLIKAECEARAGNTGAALAILNDFRKKRFNNATTYIDLTAGSADAALRLVIDERKREFVGRGYRWFDQRRLSKDAGFVSTVTRVFNGTTYTLAPGSNRYVYPIADKNITQNPEITQNPR